MATTEKTLPADEEYSEVDLNDDDNNSPKNKRPISSSDVAGLKIVTDKIKNDADNMPTVFTSKTSTTNAVVDQQTNAVNDSTVVKNGVDGDDDENNLKKNVAPPLSNSNERIAAAVASETNEQTFERLKNGIKDGTVSPKEVVNSVFQVVRFIKQHWSAR